MNTRSLLRIGLVAVLTLAVFLPKSIAQKASPARGSVRNAVVRLATPSASAAPLAPNTGTKALQPEQAKAIAEVASYLTPACRSELHTFYVRYDDTGGRGLAGKDTVIVDGNVPIAEFRALLIHEMLGHLQDLGCLTGHPQSGLSPFRDGQEVFFKDDPSVRFYEISWSTEKRRRTDSADADFVSGYARSDAFEDLAESVTFYMLHREEFRRMAEGNDVLRRKFLWIETIAYPHAQNYAISTFTWDADAIPWDTTVVPYAWIGPAVATR